MLTFAAFLFFIITGCGRIPQPFDNGTPIPHYIDPYFNPMLAQFQLDARAHNVQPGAIQTLTVIKFSDSSNDVPAGDTGACVYSVESSALFYNFHKEISFRSFLKQLSPDLQYKTFLHEIGHCVYDLHHDNSNPYAIMAPGVLAIVPSQWGDLENEFFQAAQSNISNWYNDNE